ncbi:MAG: PD-(D/E)XK nuclease family protein, partial [Clostridium sp.]|nr:PD-(D/E)XK nuclease family protein [Clostridium sp.]
GARPEYDPVFHFFFFPTRTPRGGGGWPPPRGPGRLHREQQFIIGIPAREMGRGESRELVLVQGVIDAYMEEEDGLVLVDYKTDRVPGGPAGRGILAERYRPQVAYYRKALEQLTGKKVKENIIYSLTLQESILL